MNTTLPTDFVTFMKGTLPKVHFPWRYQHGKYVLKQQLFYENGSWRTFKIFFDFDQGYDFHSIFYFGNSDGSPSAEVTRSQFDKLHTLTGGNQIFEYTETNHPDILDWLEKRKVIQQIPEESFDNFRDTISQIWKKWNPNDLIFRNRTLIDLVSPELVRYFELGGGPPREEKIRPLPACEPTAFFPDRPDPVVAQHAWGERERKGERAREQASDYAEKNLESNVSIYPTMEFPPTRSLSDDIRYIPSKEGTVEWAPRSPTQIDGMFCFTYESESFHVFASFDFSEKPFFRFGQWLPRTKSSRWSDTITQHAKKWRYHYLDENGFNVVMRALLDTGSIKPGSITDQNRKHWTDRCCDSIHGKVRELPWTDLAWDNMYHPESSLSDLDIVRW